MQTQTEQGCVPVQTEQDFPVSVWEAGREGVPAVIEMFARFRARNEDEYSTEQWGLLRAKLLAGGDFVVFAGSGADITVLRLRKV